MVEVEEEEEAVAEATAVDVVAALVLAAEGARVVAAAAGEVDKEDKVARAVNRTQRVPVQHV